MKWCCSTRFHAICLTCRRCGHIWYFRYPTEKIITICNHDVSNHIFYLRKSHRYYWCRLYLFLTVILVYQNDTSIFKNKWTMNFKKNEQRAAPSHWKPVRVYNYMRVRTSKCNACVTHSRLSNLLGKPSTRTCPWLIYTYYHMSDRHARRKWDHLNILCG